MYMLKQAIILQYCNGPSMRPSREGASFDRKPTAACVCVVPQTIKKRHATREDGKRKHGISEMTVLHVVIEGQRMNMDKLLVLT